MDKKIFESDLFIAYEYAKLNNAEGAYAFLKNMGSNEIAVKAYERGELDKFAYHIGAKNTEVNIFDMEPGVILEKPANHPVWKSRAMHNRSTLLDSVNAAGLVQTQTRPDLTQKKHPTTLVEEANFTVIYSENAKKLMIPGQPSDIEVKDIPDTYQEPDFGDVKILGQNITKLRTLVSKIPITRAQISVMIPETLDSLKEDVHIQIMNAIADRALYGTGISGSPLGAYYNDGLTKISGASFSKAKALEMIRRVSNNGAPKADRFFLINPTLEEILANRPIITGGEKFIIENGKLLGYNYLSDVNVESDHVWYGYWPSIIVLLHPRELIMNPYSSAPGTVIMVTRQPYDIVVREADYLILAEDVD